MSAAKHDKSARARGPKHQAPSSSSPVDSLAILDPGDETQRSFRYQHAYGVILIVQAMLGTLPYVAVWCEQHEDFLAQRSDELFDAWQVKTRSTAKGPWKLLDEGLVRSIQRFCDLDELFPEKISKFVFASNMDADTVTVASADERRRGRCPLLFLEHLRNCSIRNDIAGPFRDPFDELVAGTAAEEDQLLGVLKRLDLQLGPSRADVDAVLAQDHVGRLPECELMPQATVAKVRDYLILKVFEACSLKVTDGARHVIPLNSAGLTNPRLAAKRITSADVYGAVNAAKTGAEFKIASSPTLDFSDARVVKSGTVLAKKLEKGGLDKDQIEDFETLARSAEQHLIMEATRHPESFPRMQADLESNVRLCCRREYLRAKQDAPPFGESLMIGVQDALKELARNAPATIWNQSENCLLGIAALLTDDCQIWFSPKFAIEAGDASGEAA